MGKKRSIVTSALPYANGDIHIGHLVEYIQTDIWVRFQKLKGEDCLYFCADDTHGTPIMIHAKEKGVPPEEIIDFYHKRHKEDFQGFHVNFDNYHSTNSKINKELVFDFFKKMQPHVEEKMTEQLFDEKEKMFLPDRFIKGICPRCLHPDQYGDNCEKCGAHYLSVEIKEPRNALTGTSLVKKETRHLFFKLKPFQDFLKKWVKSHAQEEVALKLDEWLKEDLKEWNISRDEPYFGFEIPGHKGKYFYVWVDAPLGYIASFKAWCEENGQDYKKIWNDENTKIYHFIGKDIIYFHCLFWPSMLRCADFKTPEKVFVHGMLSVNGEKMSKSKGTFIKARTYLKHLNPDHLRYYYASKLGPTIKDLDLNLQDFMGKTNGELIGKISNLASRGAQMVHKRFSGKLGVCTPEGEEILKELREKREDISRFYEQRDFFKVIDSLRESADKINKYFNDTSPWLLVKKEPQKAQNILTDTLNAFYLLCIYLSPVIPSYSKKASKLLGLEKCEWSNLQKKIENKTLNEYTHLLQPIEEDILDEIQKETSR